jgi:F-type H+-transporting ATPase subunit delta
MKISPQNYAQALYEAVQDANPKDHDLILDNFAKILAQNGDLNIVEKIDEEYRRLEMKEKGIREAEVTFARSQEINSTMVNQLNEIVGNKVEIKSKVDEGIVGGVIIKIDDTLIDASVRTQLENLNQQLKS